MGLLWNVMSQKPKLPIASSHTLGFNGLNSVRTEASAHHGKGLVRTQTALSQFTLAANWKRVSLNWFFGTPQCAPH